MVEEEEGERPLFYFCDFWFAGQHKEGEGTIGEESWEGTHVTEACSLK